MAHNTQAANEHWKSVSDRSEHHCPHGLWHAAEREKKLSREDRFLSGTKLDTQRIFRALGREIEEAQMPEQK